MIATGTNLIDGHGHALMPVFHVVVFYENRDAAFRAKSILGRVAARFHNDFVFSTGEWSFDMVGFSSLRNMALHEAGEADLIVISIDDQEFVPGDVMGDLTAWPRTKRERPAILMLLWDDHGDNAGGLPAARELLSSAAKDRDMSFLCDGPDWAEEDIDAEIEKLKGRDSEIPSK